MQLFKFFHTENTSKQQKMVAFARNCSVRMTLRLFQSISVFYKYGANASEAVQKISTRTLLSYANLLSTNKTANFKATPMKKHI